MAVILHTIQPQTAEPLRIRYFSRVARKMFKFYIFMGILISHIIAMAISAIADTYQDLILDYYYFAREADPELTVKIKSMPLLLDQWEISKQMTPRPMIKLQSGRSEGALKPTPTKPRPMFKLQSKRKTKPKPLQTKQQPTTNSFQ
ncbi:hypothetical protein OCU04_009097 [Sclerotinia nivalis]|uniref:Uncharacterized protein n=1 Tax=Sclerotinia nivalis TaxID=352851 RepID=A0A9X0AGY4_9HELO|nr:hypothetical protein OCU04_009097 [Sclerotinia nivalis]